jgi:exopolysaccharide biosynthesis WecB/TagA/CpsF family protein
MTVEDAGSVFGPDSSVALPSRRMKQILGVTIADLEPDEAVAAIESALLDGGLLRIGFCNAHTANLAFENPDFARLLGGFLLLPDGVGVDVAARWSTGAAFRANLNGTDFIPAMLGSLRRPCRIVLFGARPGVAEKAAAALRDLAPRHRIESLGHGFLDAAAIDAALLSLERAPADILLVAMGNPLQERFIASRISARHARIAFGVGALFDFLSGGATRAPALIRSLRLEWLFRLVQEPRRLFRRYVIGNPLFLWRAFRQARNGRS